MRIKIPDAIIAATALHHQLVLATRNTDDFKEIEGLAYINPFEPQNADPEHNRDEPLPRKKNGGM